jgi:hypothetical protein
MFHPFLGLDPKGRRPKHRSLAGRTAHKPRRFRPGIEPLEARCVPSTCGCPPVDTNTADAERSLTDATAWWSYHGVDATFLSNHIVNDNARIIDLKVESAAPYRFSAVLVQNTGCYAKTWWWYYDQTASQLYDLVTDSASPKRLLDLEAYTVGGQRRFAAVLVPNTGPQAKTWWYYYDVSPNFLTDRINQNNARIVDLDTYLVGGQRYYAAVMVANQGVDAKAWEWWVDQTPAFVANKLTQDNMRLLDLEWQENGHVSVVMVPLQGEYWWWDINHDLGTLVDLALARKARILDLDSQLVGGQRMFADVQIGQVVCDQPLTGTPVAITASEGVMFNGLVATFTDADPLAKESDFTATIDWGNGQKSAGFIVKIADNPKTFRVIGQTAYGEEGSYPVKVTITDIDTSHDIGGNTVTVQSPATVLDGPLVTDGLLYVATEGVPFVNAPLVDFVDGGGFEGAGEYSATIDWGAGPLSSGTIQPGGIINKVLGSHTYTEDGLHNVTIQITDKDGGATVITIAKVLVQESPLSVNGVAVTAVEGSPFNGTIATFTDTGAPEPVNEYTATVQWDAVSPPEPATVSFNGTFQVSGMHTYTEEGVYTVIVTVRDDAFTYTAFSTVAVRDAPLSATGVNIGATEGTTFTATVASFTDAAVLEAPGHYSAVIQWSANPGDISAGLLVPNMTGGYDVVGTHTYAEEGAYPITVTIQDEGGSSVIAASAATVADAPLFGLGSNLSITPGVPLTNALVGIFMDGGGPEPIANYSVSIDWNDGSPIDTVTGTILGSGPLFQVTGSHTYASAGPFSIIVTIQDEGGSMLMINSLAGGGGGGGGGGGAEGGGLWAAFIPEALQAVDQPSVRPTPAERPAGPTTAGPTAAAVLSKAEVAQEGEQRSIFTLARPVVDLPGLRVGLAPRWHAWVNDLVETWQGSLSS